MRRLAIIGVLAVVALTAGILFTSSLGQASPNDSPAESPSLTSPSGSAFTYQGKLADTAGAVNGNCDFIFNLFDSVTSGNQIGNAAAVPTVQVAGGLFTVKLDFGSSAWTGDARFLDISVRCPAGSGSYTTLTPRQELTPTPYALRASSAGWGGLTGVPAGFADNIDNDMLSATNCQPGHVLKAGGGLGEWSCATDNTGSGGGSGWSLTGNDNTNNTSNFLGTTDNNALDVRVNGAKAFSFVPTGNSPSIIGGSGANYIIPGVVGAVIGGGGVAGKGNSVQDSFGTISGGSDNVAGNNFDSGTNQGMFATVGGGGANAANGGYSTIGGGFNNYASSDWATIGGGKINSATAESATIGGGAANSAGGPSSTVSGGQSNLANGDSATVIGGFGNAAAGDYSIAGGRNTAAAHLGTIVLADASNVPFYSTAENQFSVRATGGFKMVTAVNGSGDATAAATLASGSGSWGTLSDVNAKINFAEIDSKDVLEKVAAMPLSTWNYKTQDESIRHIGPMAQDFYAAFGVGEDAKHISTVDADGVQLAAIQGLYGMVQERDAKIADLEASHKVEIAALEARLDAIEAGRAAIVPAQSLDKGAGSIFNILMGLSVGGLLIGGVAAFGWTRRTIRR